MAFMAERLNRVRMLRGERNADPSLRARVEAIKRYQHRRFTHDYSALLSEPRYSQAANFFLGELYGPVDFTDRDAEFERVLPWMARLLPESLMRTVDDLIELHALTEELDQRMATELPTGDVDDQLYRAAWRVVGRRLDRERQLALLLAVGRALDRHARNKAVTATLRIMRRPAQAAGLGRLQALLEAGMAALARMDGAQAFLRTIEANEQKAMDILFE